MPISNSIFTSNNNIKFYITTQIKIASKKQNVEHKCILQERRSLRRRLQKNLRTPGFRVCCFDCGLFYHLGFIFAGSGNGVLKCQMSPIKVLTCAWRNENKTDVEAICIQITNQSLHLLKVHTPLFAVDALLFLDKS